MIPNHAMNWAVIEGSEKDIAWVRKSLIALDDQGNFEKFDFDQLYPTPVSLLDGDGEWRKDNWGTEREGFDGQIWQASPTRLVLGFQTFWTPPFELYEYLEESEATDLTITAVGEQLEDCDLMDWRNGIWVYGDASAVFSMKLVVSNFITGETVGVPYAEVSDEKIAAAKQDLASGDEDEDEGSFGMNLEVSLL